VGKTASPVERDPCLFYLLKYLYTVDTGTPVYLDISVPLNPNNASIAI